MIKRGSIENSGKYLAVSPEFSNKTIPKKSNMIHGIVYKKGQEIMGMSIGTMFSIFIIIIIIAVAIYAIVHFLGVNRCTEVGFFYEDLQDEIDKAWGRRYNDEYEGNLAGSGVLKTDVEEVCFGNLTASTSRTDRDRQNEFKYESRYNRNANIFMYPADKVCQGLASKKIEHVRIDDFFCVDAEENNGKIIVRLQSETSYGLVKLSKA